jgi:hypothetical protein
MPLMESAEKYRIELRPLGKGNRKQAVVSSGKYC